MVAARIGQVFKTGRSSVEAHFLSKSGRRTPYFFTGVQAQIDGRPGLLGMGIDISNLRDAERDLVETREKFDLFITHAPAALAMFDREMRYIAASNRWLADYGIARSETIGRSHYDVFPEIPESWRDVHRRALAGEVVQKDEDVFCRADGTKQWLRWEVRPWKDYDEQIGGIVIFSEDITQRKIAEEGLRSGEEKFRVAFEKAAFAAALSREIDGRITSVNDKFVEIFGYTRDEAIGRTAVELGLYSKEIRNELLEEFDSNGFIRDHEIILHLKSREQRIMLVNFDLAEIGGEHYVLSTATDITERRRAQEALSQSEARLRMALDAARIGTFDWDVPNDRITWSHWHEELWGFEPGEFDGTYDAFAARVHPDDIDRVNAAVEKCIAERSRFTTEFRVVWPDSTVHWINGIGEFEFGDDGTPLRMRGVVVEITDRKSAETALADRATFASLNAEIGLSLSRTTDLREMLRQCAEAVVRNLGVSVARIWTLDRANNELILQASAGVPLTTGNERLNVGHTIVGCIAQDRSQFLTNDLLSDPRISDDSWIRSEKLTAFAGYPLQVDRRVVGVAAVYSTEPLTEAVCSKLASIAGALAVGIERKRSELLLESVVNNVIDGLITIDEDGIVHSFNASAARMFGYFDSEVVGRNISMLMDEPYRSQHDKFIDNYLRTGDAKVIGIGRRVEGRRKNGKNFPVQLAINEFSVDGKRHFTGVVRDVTREEALEDQLRQAQKMEAIGQLAGGIAHDFNNVLTVILGYSESLLRKLPEDDSKTKSVQAIHEAGKRAASLTNQLLAFSRRAVVQPVELDLNQAVKETETLLKRLIGENIDFQVKLNSAPLVISADPGQLSQVLMNPAVNGRDAMPKGGQLTIETFESEVTPEYIQLHPYASLGKYAVVAVSDSGHGMTADVRARIFEPFFTTKGLGKGTGLGLATIYGIVKQAGGHIDVYSEVNKGTTFKVYIPLIETASHPDSGTISRGSDMIGGTETILLVEDEEMVRELATETLRSLGYRVLPARDANEARRIAADERIDLLFTDVVMPGMSGTELAAALTSERPDLKVLFASGYTDDAVVRHGLIERGSGFLQKPYSPIDLAKKLREILDGVFAGDQ